MVVEESVSCGNAPAKMWERKSEWMTVVSKHHAHTGGRREHDRVEHHFACVHVRFWRWLYLCRGKWTWSWQYGYRSTHDTKASRGGRASKKGRFFYVLCAVLCNIGYVPSSNKHISTCVEACVWICLVLRGPQKTEITTGMISLMLDKYGRPQERWQGTNFVDWCIMHHKT